MIVDDLSSQDLSQCLAGPGLRLRTGPFVAAIRSRLPAVAQGIALHYGAHPVEGADGFADFHVQLAAPRNLRRWLHPQIFFRLDGESPFKPLPADQAFPMLEWGLNWCISNLCHQYLTIHAAVVEKSGKALILPAPPGSGKSTLCAGLIHRGWRLLSDELALIDPASGQLTPLPRPVSLKNESIEVIRRFAPAAVFNPAVHDTTKGTVAHARPPAASVRRADEPARPGWVVLPRFSSGAQTRLTPLPKARALMQLADNAFNYGLYGDRGFETLANLIENAGCYEFTYSRLEEAVEVFDELAGHT